MKTIAKTIGMFVMLMAFTTSFSQNYTDTETSINGFQSTTAENGFLASQNAQISQSGTNGSSVFISQVGNGNDITSRTESNSGAINYIQQGSNNSIFVDLKANQLDQTVVQRGTNHSVLNFNSAKLDFHKGEIIQEGNNQSLTWYGGNSISEKLKVKMEGNSQSVIVRSFN